MPAYSRAKRQSIGQSGLEYVISHVFCPLKLPQGNDHSLENDLVLLQAVVDVALAFNDQLPPYEQLLWMSIMKMLRNLKDSIRFSTLSAKEIEFQISAMHNWNRDMLVYMIRAQNAAVIMRKFEHETIFESFEISPDPTAVMGAKGKLICSYPGPAIAVPNAIVGDSTFIEELANFLVHMDQDVLEDAAATRTKAKTTVIEERDTTHPRYITELLTGILRGLGNIADVPRIRKRIGDDVLWDSAKLPWRRSPLWLVIRVALQTTLERNALARTMYKSFMLFFMARLTKLALDDDMSNDILHFMSAKMARRLFKLGSSASSELSHTINEVTSEVHGILEERWRSVQDAHQASPPCQHHIRGTINDFFDTDASFLVAAHSAEPSLALADFETVVRSGIDHWTTESACISIEACASAYSSRAMNTYKGNAENLSIMLITHLELWVAMDKIVTGQILLLADYSPEIPLTLLEHLLVCKSSALDRVKRLHAYLKARHQEARSPLSAFSSTTNDESFAVRYFYESTELRSLKLAIEADAREERGKKKDELQTRNQRYTELQKSAEALSHQYTYTSRGQQRHKTKRCPKCRLEKDMQSMSIVVHEWPLPAREEDAIVVVFELACPIAFDLWRSTTFHILALWEVKILKINV
ncbi:hypothetical protein M405DRAFT_880615 [Rhizopogon salebrosus TDB-379]|nr:hypothetical protein M405DRAFT_880615 [Rhizopogon salebrosus TDB-379]